MTVKPALFLCAMSGSIAGNKFADCVSKVRPVEKICPCTGANPGDVFGMALTV